MKNINKKLLLLIFLLGIISCKSVNSVLDNEINFNQTSYGTIFLTTVFPARGVILLVHGLNTNPEKMGDDKSDGTLAKYFLDAGYHVYRVTLPGHSGDITEMQNVKAQDWLNSALSQYHEAANIAINNNIPIYLAAFSLGSLVYLNLLHNDNNVVFEKMVFLAPAIATKKITRVGISAASVFCSGRSIISSRAPAEYRAQRGVSVSAYKALFELESNLHANEFANCNINTLIFIDPNDELINISGLGNIITNYNLSNWNIETISNTGAVINPNYHHLIIDNKSLSPDTWNALCVKILQFLTEL